MKLSSAIMLVLLVVITQCSAQKVSKESPISKNSKTKTTSEVNKIVLREFTRGTEKSVTYTKTSKIISLNGALNRIPISPEEWKKLQTIISPISFQKIESFVPTSSKHQSDGALHAVISISDANTTYSSQTFDSGNPPIELRTLYTALAANFGVKK